METSLTMVYLHGEFPGKNSRFTPCDCKRGTVLRRVSGKGKKKKICPLMHLKIFSSCWQAVHFKKGVEGYDPT
jgi:hypothetical protein